MKNFKKIFAGFLTAATIASTTNIIAVAAAPTVSTDETMFVNLDYYGKTQKVNVVKGCSLNGNKQFTDYGSYESVLNMSGNESPNVSDDSVTWNLPEGLGRFYYQCTLKNNNIVSPWTFDVSYKLNGVPTDVEKLAGASGLVEIDIHATPNKDINSYYKNNMILEIGTAFKMKDTLSVEADGAQLQAIGEYKAVVFAAVPGEEKEYKIRVGTNKFETIGIVMLMEPGTLSQLKDIRELKDDKDKVKGSLNSINESTNSVLTSLEGMTAGINSLQSGLLSVDQARDTLSANKAGVYKKADQALADLNDTIGKTSALVPHMKESEQLVTDVSTDVNALNDSLVAMKPQITSLSGDLMNLHNDVNNLSKVLIDMTQLSSTRASSIDLLQKNLGTVNTDVKNLSMLGKAMLAKSSQLSSDTSALSTTLTAIARGAAASGSTDLMTQAIGAISAKSSPALTDLAAILAYSSALSDALSEISAESDSLALASSSVISTLTEYFKNLDSVAGYTGAMLGKANNVGSDLQILLSEIQVTIDKVDALNKTVNNCKDGAVQTLKDTESLTNSITNGLTSASAFLSSLETLMQSCGNQFDEGTKKCLSGSISVLQQSLEGLGNTGKIRNSSNEINSLFNKELDKFEKDNNLMNLDYEAKPISLTSLKNPTPSSIQIIMRTEEVTATTNAQKIQDLEKGEEGVSPMVKIKNVFVKVWQLISSLFKKK